MLTKLGAIGQPADQHDLLGATLGPAGILEHAQSVYLIRDNVEAVSFRKARVR